MKDFLKSICYSLIISLFFAPNISLAEETFDEWKQDFYKEALKSGISEQTLHTYLPKMNLRPAVIRLDTEKPEYLQNFFDYIGARLTDERIQNGRKMMYTYPTWLKRISEKYGVQPAYLIAFWGMETNYGSIMGRTPMLDSLSSLAYHPRRRTFFTKELIAYLKIVQAEPSVAPKLGSWDGGFGHFQFMPTTFWMYATDGDNNGRRDLVHNMPDAFSSAANYLSDMKWNSQEPWGREVVISPDDIDWYDIHINPVKSVEAWQKKGIVPKYRDAFPDSELKTKARLRLPMGINGPVFLTYPNFDRIMRWNKSELYAFSVGLLADILDKNIPAIKRPDDFIPFKTVSIIEMQEKLTALGYSVGHIDGAVGAKTRTAIRQFQKEHQMPQDGYPNNKLFEKLDCCKK